MKDVKGKRIYVGLSGGVDSAVSAALLKHAGAVVTGVFIKGWYPPGMPCTWSTDRRDAMRVAARLHIPFETLDASAEYKREVIDYLLREYKLGRTPNPDVMCNREIKFGVFYRYALSRGADYIATGHYRSGDKDQSYFLWAVPRETLKKTVFPVAAMQKSTVRALAKKFSLPVAEKKDSQGICFLGAVSVKEFLLKELGDNPAILHTLGERVDGVYVVEKNVEKGTIKLADAVHSGLSRVRFSASNWSLDSTKVDSAQLRYRGPLIPGSVTKNVFKPTETLKEIATPGQSIVFYRAGTLLGGGIID
jgi:tRNA-specific 2-thiouridylase